nr:unnamed protein product [Timema monikensis]
MANKSSEGLALKHVLSKLHAFASPALAESWDNVGLLVEPVTPRPISNILLTNDLTEAVMQEALELSTDLIISYHPPIFVPLKSLTTKTWKERLIATCLENRVALYSPHTSWDVVKDGIPVAGHGTGRLCVLKKPISILEAVDRVKKHISIPYVRLALASNKDQDSLITTVALCPGSGTSVLKGVKADLWLTGEMFHHDVLDAVHKGTHVILCNHSDSERGFLTSFADTLTKLLDDKVCVRLSLSDCDPLKTV